MLKDRTYFIMGFGLTSAALVATFGFIVPMVLALALINFIAVAPENLLTFVIATYKHLRSRHRYFPNSLYPSQLDPFAETFYEIKCNNRAVNWVRRKLSYSFTGWALLGFFIAGAGLSIGTGVAILAVTAASIFFASLTYNFWQLLPSKINPIPFFICVAMFARGYTNIIGIDKYCSSTKKISNNAFKAMRMYLNYYQSTSYEGSDAKVRNTISKAAMNSEYRVTQLILKYPNVLMCLSKEQIASFNLPKRQPKHNLDFFYYMFNMNKHRTDNWFAHYYNLMTLTPQPKTSSNTMKQLCAELIHKIRTHAPERDILKSINKIHRRAFLLNRQNIVICSAEFYQSILESLFVHTSRDANSEASAFNIVAAVLTAEGREADVTKYLCADELNGIASPIGPDTRQHIRSLISMVKTHCCHADNAASAPVNAGPGSLNANQATNTNEFQHLRNARRQNFTRSNSQPVLALQPAVTPLQNNGLGTSGRSRSFTR